MAPHLQVQILRQARRQARRWHVTGTYPTQIQNAMRARSQDVTVTRKPADPDVVGSVPQVITYAGSISGYNSSFQFFNVTLAAGLPNSAPVRTESELS